MTDRNALMVSIANTIRTYRAGEIPEPNAEHVSRWVNQFALDDQLPVLQALDPLMRRCFVTREEVVSFLQRLVTSKKVAGDDPAAFWRSANFLRVQHNGNSQNEMLAMFGQLLMQTYGFSIEDCGSPGGPYIYLDDVMCTGNRVTSDLETWIMNTAPTNAKLHVILLITHASGVYYMRKTRIPQIKANAGKSISINYWYNINVENRFSERNLSEVFWPVNASASLATQQYANQGQYPFTARVPVAHESRVFETEAGRQVLENVLLEAGMRIRSHQANPSAILKPLGYGGFNLGFGCAFATYRNCPNNAPLALWWGNGDANGPLQWYPLLPRNTYANPPPAQPIPANGVRFWQL